MLGRLDKFNKMSDPGQANPVGSKEELENYKFTINRLIEEIDNLARVLRHVQGENARLVARNQAIETSALWRALAPLRRFASRHTTLTRYLRRVAKLIWWTFTGQLRHRWSVWSDARRRLQISPGSAPSDTIAERFERVNADIRREIAAARTPALRQADVAVVGPKISIILPVYKTPIDCLDQAIKSVRAQTYINWELCICDDGSADPDITSLINRHVALDPRIKLQTLPQNGGISAASNAALSLATGEFVGLLDHDDILLPKALAIFAERFAADDQLDALYSDEATISEDGEPIRVFTKPDWSPELLLSMMYIGHFTVYRRALVAAVGGFRSEYDFSQDYDLALRATERSRKIGHIPQVLYCWRAIAASGAAGGKPYARASNIAAATDALRRRGLKAVSVPLPQSNRYAFASEAMTQKVSIIIPSDNPTHIEESVSSIRDGTAYENREIIVVTNSGAIAALTAANKNADIKFVPYDKPFNFSDKCNVGAAAATGDTFIFYNDDVRTLEKHWVEALLESLSMNGVAAAGPKLLYENRTIQHAGMVVGVRRLVGTAFHCLSDETGDHFNFAQSARDVTLLCGACLAIRSSVFRDLGGFDAVNVPISHSDVDLCLRIQEAGYRCVYTPHAKLLHVGHASIGATEVKKASDPVRTRKDKADIFLLKRWSKEIGYDPYFPPTIRDFVYRDSPEPYQIFAPERRASSGGSDVLIISHDLSASGAPKIVFEMAAALKREGHFVAVVSPSDGHYRNELQELGIPVIIDALLLRRHESVLDFARNFDRVIANTVVTWPAVLQLSLSVDVYWYLHESELVDKMAHGEPLLQAAIALAKDVWVGSRRAERIVERYRPGVFSLEYGLDAWSPPERLNTSQASVPVHMRPIVVGVFGSFEPRKGQDLAVKSARNLPSDVQDLCEFRLFGRVLDPTFHANILDLARGAPYVSIGGELTPQQYMEELDQCDIVLVPSRDDTLPLVSLDALRAGKVLICSPAVGTVDYLGARTCAVIASSSTVEDMSRAILDAVNRRDQWSMIGLEAKKVFEHFFAKRMFERRLIERLNLGASSESLRSVASIAEIR
jgi:GT2 family glycosyltransferase/glycosyltransferase involved in cell wall biosynthesis